MKNKYLYFTDVNKLKEFEKVSDRVSDRYVPIYTSEVVKNLSPEFDFVSGTKFSNSCTQHMVHLNIGSSNISISNSYDRSKSFSLYLVSHNVQIPLNLEKQVHIGQNASRLTADFKLNKPDILEAIKNAEQTINTLKNTKIVDRIKSKLQNIVFATPMLRKGFSELDVKSLDNISVYEYINDMINTYICGDYHVVVKNKYGQNVVRKGRVVKSKFTKVVIMNRVFKYINSELPELSI